MQKCKTESNCICFVHWMEVVDVGRVLVVFLVNALGHGHGFRIDKGIT